MSLLSIIPKLLEKQILNILLDIIFTSTTSYPPPPPPLTNLVSSPFGSTTDALITACHHIQSLLDSSSSVCGVFLDIRKAFDSVSHTALLQKLYSINLPSNLCSWFNSYLSGSNAISENQEEYIYTSPCPFQSPSGFCSRTTFVHHIL